jgi:hypothetical protein
VVNGQKFNLLKIIVMAEIKKFWVVTKPNRTSGLIDILFESDIKGMDRQFKGGLTTKEIVGIYTTKSHGEKVAKKALGSVK